MIPRRYKNQAHQGAFEAGVRARAAGIPREGVPYERFDPTSRYFRRAWLAGYDCASIEGPPGKGAGALLGSGRTGPRGGESARCPGHPEPALPDPVKPGALR